MGQFKLPNNLLKTISDAIPSDIKVGMVSTLLQKRANAMEWSLGALSSFTPNLNIIFRVEDSNAAKTYLVTGHLANEPTHARFVVAPTDTKAEQIFMDWFKDTPVYQAEQEAVYNENKPDEYEDPEILLDLCIQVSDLERGKIMGDSA